MSCRLQNPSPGKGAGRKVRARQGALAATSVISTLEKKDESQALPVNSNDAEQVQFPAAFNQSSLLP